MKCSGWNQLHWSCYCNDWFDLLLQLNSNPIPIPRNCTNQFNWMGFDFEGLILSSSNEWFSNHRNLSNINLILFKYSIISSEESSIFFNSKINFILLLLKLLPLYEQFCHYLQEKGFLRLAKVPTWTKEETFKFNKTSQNMQLTKISYSKD